MSDKNSPLVSSGLTFSKSDLDKLDKDVSELNTLFQKIQKQYPFVTEFTISRPNIKSISNSKRSDHIICFTINIGHSINDSRTTNYDNVLVLGDF